MTGRLSRHRVVARSRDDTGNTSLGAAIAFPGVIALLVLMVTAGRLASSHGAIETAANEAARAASVQRTPTDGANAAQAAAQTTLDSTGTTCTTLDIAPQVSGLSAPLGAPAQVTVTVTCTVPLSALGVPDRTITYTATSAVDPYRSR